ncbi:MAG TPA: NAD-dependent malic enzyme [Blastocatellia bacterium]|nr:NAD-dependent malic enzyme [Blastocatellia bacterium]
MTTKKESHEAIEVSLTGHMLLDNPLLNKGTAFPDNERREFELLGLLPPHAATMDEQLARTYGSYKQKDTDIERYIFLISLQDRNETLFYHMLESHITEMMPIIYTPVVGLACQQFSRIYRRPRGLFISYPERNNIDSILANAPHSNPQVIVVTDGERILGLGDLGVGGMGIPVGKLSLYTLCAGIPPQLTLPVMLDCGTNNQGLLEDPLYLGWRHERVRGDEYDQFVEAFISAVTRRFPNVLLQWEDFSKNNAARLLDRYRDRLCTFNDDIQGTGAVALAGLLAAAQVIKSKISEQRVVMFGAGSSATGISDQIKAAMMSEGLTEEEAKSRIWLIDSHGLVLNDGTDSEPSRHKFAQQVERVKDWQLENTDGISFMDVVRNLRPTVLIGTSAQPGAFTREVVREMAAHVERPIIFPLSNPTSKSEAAPSDLINWTDGRALVATGSPFPPVTFKNRIFHIGQCNNAFIFPGVGLGVLASNAQRVTDEMFVAAARALAEFSPALDDDTASLFPSLEDVRKVSRRVALAVATEAERAGLAETTTREEIERRIDEKMWLPRYAPYKRKKG